MKKEYKTAFLILSITVWVWLIVVAVFEPKISSFLTKNLKGTFNITDTPPILDPIANITVNESDLVQINVSGFDPNGNNVTFYYTAPLNSSGEWQTDYQDSGVYVVTVTISDGVLNTSQDVTITVNDAADIDNDGIPDGDDYLWGFNPDVNTNTTTVNISVDGTTNLSLLFNGTLLTKFRDNGTLLIEFYYNYSEPCTLILWEVYLEKQGPNSSFGSTLIRGINSSCIIGNKTLYVEEIDTSTDKICAKDQEIISIENISSQCNQANETLVNCDGISQSGYVCVKSDAKYNISGFNNSAAREYVEEEEEKPPGCDPSWVCTEWVPAVCPPSETQTRTCIDDNDCGEDENKPDETRSCTYTPECTTDSDCPEGYNCVNGSCELEEEEEEELVEEKPIEIEEIGTTSSIICDDTIDVVEKKEISLDEFYIPPELLPEGYELIISPFRLDCNGQDTLMHLSIPNNFEDIEVLRCSGTECEIVVSSTIETIGCPEEEIELEREDKFLELEAMPVEIKTVSSFAEKGKIIETGKYSVEFLEEKDSYLSFDMPSSAIEQPKNKNVKIVGTPLIIKVVSGKVLPKVKVTMPFFVEDEEYNTSIAIYAQKIDNGKVDWLYIGGEIDDIDRTISAEINLNDYVQNGVVVLAPMSTYCPNCYSTRFENVFTPTPDSRDAVLLVHGLFSTPKTWQDAVDDIRMTNQPFQLWTFAYPSAKSPRENAIDLANSLETYQFRYDDIYIIGHSLGGLVLQHALDYAYEENKKNPDRYLFIKKVRTAILVSVPSEGTPFTKYVKFLVNDFVNKKLEGDFYSLHPEGYEQLSKGINITPVPWIDYKVIAGTKSYPFLDLTNLYFNGEVNDGIVSMKSSLKIGDKYLTRECEDYWGVPATHTEQTEDPRVRKIVEQIIAKSVNEELRKADLRQAIMGYSNYFEFGVKDCSPDDIYIVMGKQIKESEIVNPVMCACGNGICGGVENEENCPEDCVLVKHYCVALIITIIIFLIITWCRGLHKKIFKVLSKPFKGKKGRE